MSWISSQFATDNTYIKYRIEVTENSTNNVLNTSNVTVKVWVWRTNTGYETYGNGTVHCTIDGAKYTSTVKTSQKITESGIYLFSKTLNIQHNSDGSKNLEVSAYIDHSRFTSTSHSFSVELTTVPRCSKLTIPSVVLGTVMTITITRDDNSFVDTISWECGTKQGTLREAYSGSTITWTPSMELAKEYPNVVNVPILIHCDTYTADGTQLGRNTVTVPCPLPDSIRPLISVTVDDDSGKFEKYNCFLQGFSTMRVKITASGQYGATIVSYTSIIDDKLYNGAEFTTEVINSSGSVTAQITVRDSRGRTETLNYEFQVVQYDPPKITSLSAIRCDANGEEYYQGEYCKVTFSAEITPLNGLNSASYRVEYKKQDESTFTTFFLTTSDGATSIVNRSCMFPADNGSSYNIYLYAVDDFGDSNKYVFSPSVFRLIHFGADGQSIAFFKRSEGDVPGDFGQAIRLSGGYVPARADSVVTMDDLVSPGCYVSTGYSVENAPFFDDYFVEVRQLDNIGECIMQKADRYSEDGHTTLVRYRNVENNIPVWTEWQELYAPASHRHSVEDIVNDQNEATALVNAMKTALVDMIYPVGSLYISTSSTSPKDLFGGEWVPIQDKFLLAAGTTYTSGEEGGAASASISISGHTHKIETYNNVKFVSGAVTSGTYDIPIVGTTGSAGAATKTIETIPPYLAVNVWRRTG